MVAAATAEVKGPVSPSTGDAVREPERAPKVGGQAQTSKVVKGTSGAGASKEDRAMEKEKDKNLPAAEEGRIVGGGGEGGRRAGGWSCGCRLCSSLRRWRILESGQEASRGAAGLRGVRRFEVSPSTAASQTSLCCTQQINERPHIPTSLKQVAQGGVGISNWKIFLYL